MSLLNAIFGGGSAGSGYVTTTTNTTNPYQNAQNQLAYDQMMAQQNVWTNTATTSAPMPPPQRKPEDIAMEIDEAQLNSEVFSTPIDTLANVWTTKYGDRWVDLDEITDDKFFGLVYKRLYQRGMIETHYLTNKAKYVCRVPEH